MAKQLNISPGSPVFQIKRLLTFDKKPLILDEIYISSSAFKGLNEEMINQKKGSLYRLYESRYGVQMLKANEKIKAVAAGDEVSKLLSITKKTPILSLSLIHISEPTRPY